MDDWVSSFDTRILPFVNLKITLEEDEIVKLGKKNEEEYPLTVNSVNIAEYSYCHCYCCVHTLLSVVVL